MNEMRDRAKKHFPMVLLTLLSIVQALALELLWSHVRETPHLFETTSVALFSWVQIAATFVGLVLIWVVYASNAMRFRWVPATSDSVYPFLIGVLEFMLVESLGPGETGQWLILMAMIYGTMVRVSHTTMRRARRDGDNDIFFGRYVPATWRDFFPQIIVVGALALTGLYFLGAAQRPTLELVAVAATAGTLIWQFTLATQIWNRTVSEDWDD